jgi:hypothetical protein
MAIAAVLAGAGAVYFTEQKLDNANFQDAISLIQNDDDAYWCKRANTHIIKGNLGTHGCAIVMPKYQSEEEEEAK